MGGDQPNSSAFISEKSVKAEAATVAELPNLIDTDDTNDYNGMDNATKSAVDQNISNLTPSTPLVDDIIGDFSGSVEASTEPKNDDDPFADVSFHSNENKGQADDLFSGMEVGNKQGDSLNHGLGSSSETDSFDIFSSIPAQGNHNEFVGDLMAGLSVDDNKSSAKQKTSPSLQSESLLSGLNNQVSHQAPDKGFGNMMSSQAVEFNVNPMFPTGHLPYNIQPGMMFNHPYPSQPLDYSAMGSLLAQQQFLTTMANFQHLSNVSMHDASSIAQIAGTNGRSPMPDIFQANFPNQTPTSMLSSSKKEDTKAFDFISVSLGIDIHLYPQSV